MKDFIREILTEELSDYTGIDTFFGKSPLLKYLDLKMGAIFGNTKTRRSLANIYAVYSILHFYEADYYNNPI